MNPAKRLSPVVAPPALRLLERPPRPVRPVVPAPAPSGQGFWQRWAEAFRRPR